MLKGELPEGIESTLDTHLIVRSSTGVNRHIEIGI
jgi:hypothetical protein